MQRENKFRGKSKDNGEWVYGDLCTQHAVHTALIGVWDSESMTCNWHPVLPETVGQYAGLKDKNRKEIYEGDIILSHSQEGEPFRSIIRWHEEKALFYGASDFPIGNYLKEFGYRPAELLYLFEVIGNIHENPDLITVPATQGNG